MRYFYARFPATAHHNGTTFEGEAVVALGYVKLPDDKMLVSFSRCSPLDTFVRKKAHWICQGRMAKGMYKEIDAPAKGTLYDTLQRLAKDHNAQVQEARYKQSQ